MRLPDALCVRKQAPRWDASRCSWEARVQRGSGPSNEVEDEHDEQDDDENPGQYISSAGDGEHAPSFFLKLTLILVPVRRSRKPTRRDQRQFHWPRSALSVLGD